MGREGGGGAPQRTFDSLLLGLGVKGNVVGDTLLVVQRTLSRPEQTVVMAPGLNIGDVITESRVRQRCRCHRGGSALRVQSVRRGRSQMSRGSRGRRDDLGGGVVAGDF